MKIVIDTRQCPCRTLNDECDINGHECYEDDICSSCPLIRNGGVILPEGHGRLVDAGNYIDVLNNAQIEGLNTYKGLGRAKELLVEAPTIVEADIESEDKK